MASGSVGLQIGVQDMQVMMLIMSDRGLGALMDSQFKIGADASIAFATIGAGVEGSTTSAAGADIIAFSRARGLFAGIALEGSLLTNRSERNRAYYGQEASPRQIVVAMQAHNPGADPLRAALCGSVRRSSGRQRRHRQGPLRWRDLPVVLPAGCRVHGRIDGPADCVVPPTSPAATSLSRSAISRRTAATTARRSRNQTRID